MHDICVDMRCKVNFFISSENIIINDNTTSYNLILDDLTSYDDLEKAINIHYHRCSGMLIMNTFSNISFFELVNSMLEVDLINNYAIQRTPLRPTVQGFLAKMQQSLFKNIAVMNNTIQLQYDSIFSIIRALREINWIKQLSHHSTISKKYLQSLQDYYYKEYQNNVTVDILTLIATK